jgi:hypothetical protein
MVIFFTCTAVSGSPWAFSAHRLRVNLRVEGTTAQPAVERKIIDQMRVR